MSQARPRRGCRFRASYSAPRSSRSRAPSPGAPGVERDLVASCQLSCPNSPRARWKPRPRSRSCRRTAGSSLPQHVTSSRSRPGTWPCCARPRRRIGSYGGRTPRRSVTASRSAGVGCGRCSGAAGRPRQLARAQVEDRGSCTWVRVEVADQPVYFSSSEVRSPKPCRQRSEPTKSGELISLVSASSATPPTPSMYAWSDSTSADRSSFARTEVEPADQARRRVRGVLAPAPGIGDQPPVLHPEEAEQPVAHQGPPSWAEASRWLSVRDRVRGRFGPLQAARIAPQQVEQPAGAVAARRVTLLKMARCTGRIPRCSQPITCIWSSQL